MSTRMLTGLAVAAFFLAGPTLAVEEHHQPGAAGAPAATTLGPQAQNPAPAMPMDGGGGMMMGGMMGGAQGGMGQGGMGMCPMMGMMGGHGAAGMAQHIEGHVAFLKAELKITQAQETPWKAFADALRSSVGSMAQMPGMPMAAAGAQTPVGQALQQKEGMLTTRLENTKRLRTAWGKLDAVLTPEQRKTADEIIGPRLAMM